MELSIAARDSSKRLLEDISRYPIGCAPDYLALVLLNLLGAGEHEAKDEVRLALTKLAGHAAELLDTVQLLEMH